MDGRGDCLNSTMFIQRTFLLGLVAAGAFAFSPVVNAHSRGGGGGGGHFGGHSGGFSHGGGFNRGGSFSHTGGFHHGGFHHGHHFIGFYPFYDPFYYGYGYPYGYGYAGYNRYYSRPVYDRRAYDAGNYSAGVDVQMALADRGYYRGRIDGVIGAGTRSALRAFQRDSGLPTTGRIDARLLGALRSG